MVSETEIRAIVDKIVEEFHPEKVILFGSYAYGTASEDSDVDLLVVMPFEGNPVWKAVEIINKIHPRIALDLLVRSKEVIKQRIEWDDFFLMEIMNKGKEIYASDN